jgi:ligand-binding sensor domain-containing protein
MSNTESKTNKYNTIAGLWGDAITYTRIDEQGKMWVGNGEYESQVNYCPMTGEAAKTQMKLIETMVTKSDGSQRIIKEYKNEK